MKKAVYEEIKKELVEKGFADNGCVAVCGVYNVGWYTLFGGLLGAIVTERSNCDWIISKRNDELIVIPYAKKTLVYEQGVSIKKQNIIKASLIVRRFTFKTVDKKKTSYLVQRGTKDDLKQILIDLGLIENKSK